MGRTEAVVRVIARRLGTQALLAAAALCLTVGLGLATALVLAERLLSLGVTAALLASVPLAAACGVAIARGLAAWPGSLAAAMHADAQLGLAERLSSALAAGSGPMANLVRRDADRHAQALDPRRSFPVRLPPRARAVPPLAAALLIALLVPSMDLLGWDAARKARAARGRAIRETTQATRHALAAIGQSARRQGLARPAQVVARIDQALASLEAPQLAPQQLQAAGARARAELSAAQQANQALRRAAGAQGGALEALRRENDLLHRASQALEQWRRQVAAASPGEGGSAARAPSDAKAHTGAPAPDAARFVRRDPLGRPDTALRAPERRLLDAGHAAAAAMARRGVPWRHRAVVQRYFSPGDRFDTPTE